MKPPRRQARVVVVGVAFSLVVAALWVRLVQVQYLRHAHYAEMARRQADETRTIPPVRGAIFDTRGRPLALSIRQCSVAIKPREIRHRRRVAGILADALDLPRREIERWMRSRKNFVYVKRECHLDETARRTLSDLTGVVVEHEDGRMYPYDGVASKVVGWVGVDGRGMAGIEAECDRELRGVPGRERVIRNGRYDTDRYYRVVETPPHEGKYVYLTIDATVQEITEAELDRAVADCGARGGAAIVMDVATGDILALAEVPYPAHRDAASHVDSLWTLCSLTHIYEPGSTFKIVTAAALLEAGAVSPDDVFDGENGSANLGFAVIRDTHPHGELTFAQAFAYSSNIIMAKAAREIDARRFYRTIRLFGFGSRTGIRMPSESPGSVENVGDWSLRTQSTIAFGQEIGVTPLQMLDAYAAIANDGVMMMPRLVKGISDPSTGEVVRFKPVRIRRVVSRHTAATLRSFCRQVVDYGTGTAANVAFIPVSGKTGTGQKAGRTGGYLVGKYVSSFVGFAPSDNPRIACIVVIDEPRWSARYGGESAAPVFARLCRSFANATDLFDGILGTRVVQAGNGGGHQWAPNFLRMDRADALDRARSLGVNVLCSGDGGRVVSQEPRPGLAIDRDAVIRLVVSDGHKREGVDRRFAVRGGAAGGGAH